MAYTYILASGRNGTLYTGVTIDLQRRLWEHRQEGSESFTKKYKIWMLVYFEYYESIIDAICCEKQIKNRKRNWKIQLIFSMNPEWKNLSGVWDEDSEAHA